MVHLLVALLVFALALCVVGLICWLIQGIPGLPEILKRAIYVLIGIAVLIFLIYQVQSGALSHGLG